MVLGLKNPEQALAYLEIIHLGDWEVSFDFFHKVIQHLNSDLSEHGYGGWNLCVHEERLTLPPDFLCIIVALVEEASLF